MSSQATRRVALITGGSGAIGAATARSLATDGRAVAVGYRSSRDQAEQVVSAITAAGGEAITIALDVTEPTTVEAAVATVTDRLGPPTIVVANAGITDDALFVRTTPERWRAVIDADLDGAYRTLRATVPAMMRAHHGRIVVVSSITAYAGAAGQASYAAAKAGLIGLTRALARELAPRAITANVVAPGPVASAMTGALTKARRDQLTASVPLGRMAAPEEVAAAVAFLASESASYITGAVLAVDGGLAMGH